jgi:tRNA threonylcarbamoyladenosine biosynthesis protein TsaB
MSLILNIETATEICSVSLAKEGKLIALKEHNEGLKHAKLLTVYIEEIFKENNVSIKELNAVAVSKGPGSYTGLRIGVSAAKGIAYAGNIPLIAVSTLQAMAHGVTTGSGFDKNTWLCPMIDARRMEVYSAFFDLNNTKQKEISADIIDENSYADILNQRQVIFFGNGAEKCKKTIQSPNAQFIDDVSCSAEHMIELSYKAFQNKQFEDVAYFEPFYLKDFIATAPRKNIFQ